MALGVAFLLVVSVAAQSTTPKPLTEAQKQALSEYQQVKKQYSDTLESANDKLSKLQSWLEGIESSAQKPDEAESVASQIQHEAEKEYDSQYDSLNSEFEKKLSALSHVSPGPELMAAEEELKGLSKQIQKLSKMVMKAMNKKYHDLRSSQKDKAQDLMQELQHEARYAMKLARHAEKFGRKAGQKESQYEGDEETAEKNTEKLSGTAEKYGEKAERVVEKFFEKVEDKVENRRDTVEHQAEDEAKKRMKRVKEAVQSVEDSSAPSPSPAMFLRAGPLQLLAPPEEMLRRGLLLPAAVGLSALGLAAFAWLRQRRSSELRVPPILG